MFCTKSRLQSILVLGFVILPGIVFFTCNPRSSNLKFWTSRGLQKFGRCKLEPSAPQRRHPPQDPHSSKLTTLLRTPNPQQSTVVERHSYRRISRCLVQKFITFFTIRLPITPFQPIGRHWRLLAITMSSSTPGQAPDSH